MIKSQLRENMIFLKQMEYWIIIFFLFLFPSICLSGDSVSAKDLEKHTYIFYSGIHSPIWEIVEGRLLEAFHRIGLKAKLVHTESAQRALVLANTEGDGDALRDSNIKKIAPQQTENLIQISEPILFLSMSVYTKKQNFQVKGWESLNGYNNGFRKGIKILEKKVPGRQSMLPTSDRLFRMLATERLDTVLEWDLIALKMLKDLKLTTIKKLSPPIITSLAHMYIHKKHEALAPHISAALAQMKKDGAFLKIKEEILK